MLIVISVVSFIAVMNRRYTFNLGWAKVESSYRLSDLTGENDIIIEMEIEHSHSYTYHIHTRIYSMPDANGEIYRITRLNFNATKNNQYSSKVNQDYDTPIDSYYKMFLIDGVGKNNVYKLEGTLEVEKTTSIEKVSEQIDFSLSYTFPYSLEDLLLLNYILLWLDVFILIGIGGLVILLIITGKSIVKEAKVPKEEREQQDRYIDYFKRNQMEIEK